MVSKSVEMDRHGMMKHIRENIQQNRNAMQNSNGRSVETQNNMFARLLYDAKGSTLAENDTHTYTRIHMNVWTWCMGLWRMGIWGCRWIYAGETESAELRQAIPMRTAPSKSTRSKVALSGSTSSTDLYSYTRYLI